MDQGLHDCIESGRNNQDLERRRKQMIRTRRLRKSTLQVRIKGKDKN